MTLISSVRVLKKIYFMVTCRKHVQKLIPSETSGVYRVTSRVLTLRILSWENFRLLFSFKFKSLLNRNKWIDTMTEATEFSDINPPNSVRGMVVLEMESFKKTVQVPGLKIPVENIGKINKKFKHSLLRLRNVKVIAELSSTDPKFKTHKLLLLDPNKYSDINSFSSDELALFQDKGVSHDDITKYDINLSYDNWNAVSILRAVLPSDVDGVSSFSQIGHIAHLNLKTEMLKYKYLVGQVLLDKVNSVKTVVNKLDTIDNTFRNFQMELLAGEDNYITTARENGCSFEFDFTKVYWNPRLGFEHKNVVKTFNRGDVLYDVFAGVGPFAIPAAKKGCIVYANDLNPHSYESLQSNFKLNKIKSNCLSFNLDGTEFIRTIIKDDFVKRMNEHREEEERVQTHIVMNLPALAIEFLDTFKSLFADMDDSQKRSFRSPTVHCYCFSKSADPHEDIQTRVETVLNKKLESEAFTIRDIRAVAPNKLMLCIKFQIPDEVFFKRDHDVSCCVPEIEEPDSKKQKLEET